MGDRGRVLQVGTGPKSRGAGGRGAQVEPVLRNKRGHNSERPAHRDGEWPPLAATDRKSTRLNSSH